MTHAVPERFDESPVDDLPNGHRPLPRIVTAGQVTEEQLARLSDAGCRTVVDTQLPEAARGFDEPAAVARHGMEYVNVPVAGAPVADEHFDRIRALLCDPARHPMLVHCRSANRVGALMLPYLVLDGDVPVEDAIATARRIGLRDGKLLEAARRYVARRQGR